MAKIYKRLTKKNIKNTEIQLAPEYDCFDNGKFFKGFIYKGILMRQHYDNKNHMLFLIIQPEFGKRHNFTFNDFYKSEARKLSEKYNVVSEVDIEELLETLENILKIINDLDEQCKVTEVNKTFLKNKIKSSILEIKEIIEQVKIKSMKCFWNMEDDELGKIRDYVKILDIRIKDAYEIITDIDDNKLPDMLINNYLQIENLFGEEINYSKTVFDIFEKYSKEEN